MHNPKQSTKHQLLLIDPKIETSRNTTFLLQLAGYRVTSARALDEAINIISVLGPGNTRPDILLIDNLEITSKTSELLSLLTGRYKYHNLLFIDRHQQTLPLNSLKYTKISPRQTLGTVKKMLTEQSRSNQISDNFQRFHSYG
ncbi:MAG: hypothetical protein L3J63_03775 [Geopsychrobacter sp.]|nr:hypothetical protein [Geopsychrobacter sp.]